jgi:hypothetical protein
MVQFAPRTVTLAITIKMLPILNADRIFYRHVVEVQEPSSLFLPTTIHRPID